jgi:2-polyprenyl-3-methyl-5-hydroxy-6-metoxy-1,4-benzoquinol methylase
MRPDFGKPYYTAYEKRYRSIYSQGVTYWSNFPAEINNAKRIIDRFLSSIKFIKGAKVIEFGCGEGFLAEHIVKQDLLYTGIDIAESAIKKAKERWSHLANNAVFYLGDITTPKLELHQKFDIGIDVSCLHMLVLNKDRNNYLQNAANLLAEDGYMLFCRELCRLDAIAAEIETYEEWLSLSGQDVDSYQKRKAVEKGKSTIISIPQIAARARSIEQYRKEVERQHFRFIKSLAQENNRISFMIKKSSEKLS